MSGGYLWAINHVQCKSKIILHVGIVKKTTKRYMIDKLVLSNCC